MANFSSGTPGIQTYTIATTGTYDITADGAQGGESTFFSSSGAGDGASVGGDIVLQAGTKLEIVVGGEGESGITGGGGGGGSFVIETGAVDTILAVAGGGGGTGEYAGGGGGGGGTAPTGGNGGPSGGAGGGGGASGAAGHGGGNLGGGGGGGFTGGNGATGLGGHGGAGAVAGTTFYGGAGGVGAGNGGVGGGGGGGDLGGGGGGGGYGGGGGGASFGYGGGGGSLDILGNPTEFAGVHSGNGLVTITEVPCYVAGTRMLTDRGEIAVENLAVGDRVVTASGAYRPVRWLGSRRVDCARHPEPSAVWPVRIEAGAFAPELPARDLWVSPGHSIFVDGVLIQAEKLVNGATITQVPLASVEYWHVELDSHDVILAEGLAAESYLDTGNRAGFFNNGGSYLEAHPDFKPKHWAETCVPLVFEGAILQGVKSRLLARAQALGYCLTADSDVHIVAAGERIEPLFCNEQRVAFVLPPDQTQIELRCRGFIPAHIDAASDDHRRLGVCVGRLQIDGVHLPLNDAATFERGWHDLEVYSPQQRQRWSQESAPLPDGTRLVVIELAGPSYCWAQPQAKAALTLCG